MDNQVRNIAPFINVRFVITSPWWTYRTDPITGQPSVLHRGLDIATSVSVPVYSMLNGYVHTNAYNDIRGYYIIIKDPQTGYATLYQHLQSRPSLNVGDNVIIGQQVGVEGTSGSSTGIHLHVEMQNLDLFNNEWHVSNNKEDYINPTEFMGIDNVKNTWWIYNGTIPPSPSSIIKKNKFKWVLYARKLRKVNK